MFRVIVMFRIVLIIVDEQPYSLVNSPTLFVNKKERTMYKNVIKKRLTNTSLRNIVQQNTTIIYNNSISL